MRRFVLVVALTLAVHAEAQVKTILLPIAFRAGARIQGAFSTVWVGEVWFHNPSASSVRLTNVSCGFDEGCAATYPGNYLGLLNVPLDDIPDRGILLSPPMTEAQALSFSNRIFEITRHAQPQGIEIPVVRDEQFFSGTSELLGVPVGAGIRSALRIYDPQQRLQGMMLRVEILDTSGNVVTTSFLTTTFAPGHNAADIFRPGFAAVLDLAQAFPGVNGLDHFHIRLTPLTAGATYWAMVSVTDNDTQQVLIITPQ